MKKQLLNLLSYKAFFALLGFATLLTGYYIYAKNNIENNTLENLKNISSQELRLKSDDYNLYNQQLATTTRFIATSQSIFNYLRDPNKKTVRAINDVFESIIHSVPWYEKVSYMDNDGTELFYATRHARVNRSSLQVDPELLAYAQALSPAEVGEWGVYIEKKEVNGETIYKPNLIRVTPITQENATPPYRAGYILAYVDVDHLNYHFRQGILEELNIEIVNQNGDYFASEEKYKLYGSQIPERKVYNFAQRNPSVWEEMQENEIGSFYNDQKLIGFYKKEAANNGFIFFISYYTQQQIKAINAPEIEDLQRNIFIAILLILVIAIPLLVLKYTYQTNRLNTLLANAALESMAAILLTDNRNRIIYANKEFEEITGYKNEEIQGKTPCGSLFKTTDFALNYAVIKHTTSNQRWESEIQYENNHDKLIHLLIRSKAVFSKNGKPEYFITYLFDTSERKELELKFKALSERDPLTDLWNRRSFDKKLKAQTQLFEQYQQEHQAVLAIMDIDHFKKINDTLGHDKGDEVLKVLAEIINNSFRSNDFIARIGGEEFALIFTNMSMENTDASLQRLQDNIAADPRFPTTMSIGVTPVNHSDPNTLYKRADEALYVAKHSGRNQIQHYKPSQETQSEIG